MTQRQDRLFHVHGLVAGRIPLSLATVRFLNSWSVMARATAVTNHTPYVTPCSSGANPLLWTSFTPVAIQRLKFRVRTPIKLFGLLNKYVYCIRIFSKEDHSHLKWWSISPETIWFSFTFFNLFCQNPNSKCTCKKMYTYYALIYSLLKKMHMHFEQLVGMEK